MNTPIADFVRGYEKKNTARFHMPGHKGVSFVGCESMDITEISGADALYEADGIIAMSEKNATQLFGTARTLYSVEGSSQCIRAMLYLCLEKYFSSNKRPKILATRNVHKAFVYAVAMLDVEVEWIMPETQHSLCSCKISPSEVESHIIAQDEPPVAVYVTSPDYLGGELDIQSIADVCHKYGTVLAVDNAHGAYLHFLEPSCHPIDMGADICCDSAHKTLPVLTGGAYLHIGKDAPNHFVTNAKKAMALFGSTSPSYLTLMSLDLCNQYITDGYREKLSATVKRVQKLRETLSRAGWMIEMTDPLKLTIRSPRKTTGNELANQLQAAGIECEYSDRDYVVLMITPENTELDFQLIEDALGNNILEYGIQHTFPKIVCEQKLSIRDAVFSEYEEIEITYAVGRVCAAPTVSCPPAIPIVISGEVIRDEHIALLEYYHIKTIDVVIDD